MPSPRPRGRRLRGWLATLLLATPFVAGGVVLALGSRSTAQLAAHQRAIAELQASSRDTNRRALGWLATGEHDLAVRVSTRLLARALQELVGYEQVTRRGNRFRIDALAPVFRDGWAEVTVRAWFDWRWGLYEGPIEVRYVAFTRLHADGSAWLHFRVAAVRMLAHYPLLRPALAPYLTLRMQRTLRLPDLELPLGIQPRAAAPRTADGVEDDPRRVRVRLARGVWALGAREAVVYATPAEIGLVAVGLGEATPAAPAPSSRVASPAHAAASASFSALPRGVDIAIELRQRELAGILERLVQAADDLEVGVAEIPIPVHAKGTLAGVAFEKDLAMRRLRGTIDLQESELRLERGRAELTVALQGQFLGFLEGTLYGVGFSVPVKLLPALRDTFAVRFVNPRGELGIFPEPRPLVIDVDVEARVAGLPLRTTVPVRIPAAQALEPLSLRQFLAADLRVPTRVERGRITAARELPARVSWRLELPDDPEGHLRVAGDVEIGATAAPAPGAKP